MEFHRVAEIGSHPRPSDFADFVVSYLKTQGPSSRGALIAAATGRWSAASGREMQTNPVSTMKKALSELRKRGIVERSGSYGVWTLVPESGTADDIDGETARSIDEACPTSCDGEPDPEDDRKPERQVGTGGQQVYCFYYDIYRELAESRGQTRWPVKIGRSDGQVSIRMQFHRTASPDEPRLALVMNTVDAASLEKVLHGILTIRGRRYSTTRGGTEWFVSNPEEIERVFRSAVGEEHE